MKSETTSLYSLAEWKNGLAYKNIEFSDSGIPIIKIAELKNGISEQTKFTQNTYDDTVFLTKGDMLFSWSGNPDTSIDVFIFNQNEGWLNQHIFKVTPKYGVDFDFLFYLLKSLKSRFAKIASNKQTIGLGHVTIKDLKEISIDLPRKHIQNKIGLFLKKFDEKIRLNTQINDNLEKQATTIFSNWISDYPTNTVALEEICQKITDGSHYSPKDDPSSNIPMMSVKDMGIYDFEYSSCKHISNSDFEKMLINDCVPKKDDILVAKDGSYMKEIFIYNNNKKLAILSSIAILRPDKTKIYPEILLRLLKNPQTIQEVKDNFVSGSVLPRIVLKDFKSIKFSLPSIEFQNKIANVLSSIRQKIAITTIENTYIKNLRDALLPKLMSGELDVPAIDI